MIAVSGSGIAGLAAALAILRNQKPVLFVAGSMPATTLHGGVQIAPNGWAALDQSFAAGYVLSIQIGE